MIQPETVSLTAAILTVIVGLMNLGQMYLIRRLRRATAEWLNEENNLARILIEKNEMDIRILAGIMGATDRISKPTRVILEEGKMQNPRRVNPFTQ